MNRDKIIKVIVSMKKRIISGVLLTGVLATIAIRYSLKTAPITPPEPRTWYAVAAMNGTNPTPLVIDGMAQAGCFSISGPRNAHILTASNLPAPQWEMFEPAMGDDGTNFTENIVGYDLTGASQGVFKLDTNTAAWALGIGGTGTDYGLSVVVETNGYIMTGVFSGTVHFGDGFAINGVRVKP